MNSYIDMTRDGYIGNQSEILSFWTRWGAVKTLKEIEYRMRYLATSYSFVTWQGREDWFGEERLHTYYGLKVARLPKMARPLLGKQYYVAVVTLTDHKSALKPSIPVH